jgi:TonB family protein
MFLPLETSESRKRSFCGSLILHTVAVVALVTIVPQITFQSQPLPSYSVTLMAPPKDLVLYEAPAVKPLRPAVMPAPDKEPAAVRLARSEPAPARPEPPNSAPPVERVEVKAEPKPVPATANTRLLVETPGAAAVPNINKNPVIPVQPLRTEPRIERPQAPVEVGFFDPSKKAESASTSGTVETGGFGNSAKTASGNARNTGGGQVETGGFGGSGRTGAGTAQRNAPDARTGNVAEAGFGQARVVRPQESQTAKAETVETPVEIIFKPRPAYTDEAREMKIQGAVSLRVMFTAQGEVRVLEVIRGLGHGLDENANQAARQIRFRPAQRNGVPVDSTATVQIIFQLAY